MPPSPADVWRRRMEGWWDANPWFTSGATRGWTVRSEGAIVGFFGVVPLGFQLAGRERVVYGSTTWRVETPFRHMSLAAIATLLRYTRESLLFVSTRTPELVKVFEGLKFARLPRGESFYGRQPNTLPLNPGRVATTLTGSSRKDSRLSQALDTVGHVYPRLVAARLERSARRLVTAELTHTDADFDALWERTRDQFPNTNVRSAASLNWECFLPEPSYRKRLFACHDRGRLRGFAVVWPRQARGLRVFECADIWTDREIPCVLDSLVAKVVSVALQDGADLIELPSFSPALRSFARSAGFLPRRLSDRGEYYLVPKGAPAALEAQTAYLCSLQGDYGL